MNHVCLCLGVAIGGVLCCLLVSSGQRLYARSVDWRWAYALSDTRRAAQTARSCPWPAAKETTRGPWPAAKETTRGLLLPD